MVFGEPTKDNGNCTNCVSVYQFKTQGETWMENKNRLQVLGHKMNFLVRELTLKDI